MGIAAWFCPEMSSNVHRFWISSPNLRIDVSFSPFTPSCVHRFLISGSDLRIDVSFSLFKSSCVHRFLISGPDLRIDAGFCLFMPSCVHRFLISGPDLGITVLFRLLRPSRQRPSASESNFRSCKEEWPASYGRRCIDLSRLILIFVAAKRNGPPPERACYCIDS